MADDLDVQRVFARFNTSNDRPQGRRIRRRLSLFPWVGGTADDGVTIEVPVDEPSGSDGEAPDLDTGTIIYDGGFSDSPTFTNQGNGKRAGGTTTDFAKFLFSIGVPVASTIYTMTYDPDFSGLSQGGALAMVGFGFKQQKKYHFAGLKGDGSSGLNANKAYGPNFGQLKATTEADGGAATHGTQAGPNWLQIEISADGDTYTLRTSSDGSSWADEFTEDLPTPLSEATHASDFGIAIYLDASDKGAFTVDITLWQQIERAPIEFVHAASGQATGGSTSYASVAFGDAAADRVLAIIVATDHPSTSHNSPTSLTVTPSGGSAIAATKVVQHGNGTERTVSGWYAEVPAGTSGDVGFSATFDGEYTAISVHRLTNLISTTPLAFTDFGGAPTASTTQTIPRDGVALGGMRGQNTADITWTGLTEVSQIAMGSLSNRRFSTAELSGLEATSYDRLIEATQSGSTANRGVVMVWGEVPDLEITGTPVLLAGVGNLYNGFTVAGREGAVGPPYTYSLVGTWPAGISINSANGAVSGTPTETGSFTGLSVRVEDADEATADLPTFTLTVSATLALVLELGGEALQLSAENLTFDGVSE